MHPRRTFEVSRWRYALSLTGILCKRGNPGCWTQTGVSEVGGYCETLYFIWNMKKERVKKLLQTALPVAFEFVKGVAKAIGYHLTKNLLEP